MLIGPFFLSFSFSSISLSLLTTIEHNDDNDDGDAYFSSEREKIRVMRNGRSLFSLSVDATLLEGYFFPGSARLFRPKRPED